MNNIKDPLIILGNGPSLGSVDFNLLNDKDTWGFKGAYKTYAEMNFWPKYWSCFDGPWFESNNRLQEIKEFIHSDNMIKYYVLFNLPGFFEYVGESDKIIKINRVSNKKYISVGETIIQSLQIAAIMISFERKISLEDAKKLVKHVEIRNNISELKSTGIIKLVNNKPISEDDKIIRQCKSITVEVPESLDNFYYNSGPSPYTACQIGVIMGYKKIVLLGIDSSYTETKQYWNNNISDVKDAYYNDNFKRLKEMAGIRYNNDIGPYDNLNNFNNIAFKRFKYNYPHIDVVNCGGELSKMDIFRRGELKDEL